MRIRHHLATALAEAFVMKERKFCSDGLLNEVCDGSKRDWLVLRASCSRGYVLVFSCFPNFRKNRNEEQGAITAIYTVLVEGDDMNELQTLSGALDGHIVLNRKLANANHFPAVDVLRSVSRLDRAVMKKK